MSLVQGLGHALSALLDAYDRGANALGRAGLRLGRRVGRRVVGLLGPVGRVLWAMIQPVWRRLTVAWHGLNVQILLRMFRPMGLLGRWVARRVGPALRHLIRGLHRLVSPLEPVLVHRTRGLERVERAAAGIVDGWRRLWAPVVAAVKRRRVLEPRPRRSRSRQPRQ